jgi:histone H2A
MAETMTPPVGNSVSARCDLTFPVARVLSSMRKTTSTKRTSQSAAVYLAAVMEYLVAEVIEVSGNKTKDLDMKRIRPRHVQLAIRTDDALDKFLDAVTIASGGVMPFVHPSLLPKKREKKAKEETAEEKEETPAAPVKVKATKAAREDKKAKPKSKKKKAKVEVVEPEPEAEQEGDNDEE